MSNFPTDYKDRPQFMLGGPYSSFHELLVSTVTPVIQIDSIYGIRSGVDTEVFSADGGTATIFDTTTGREFHCKSGNSNIGGYGVIRSQRALRYQAGVGQIMRIGGRFGTPQTLTGMRIGGFTSGNELSFGYHGTRFGILNKSGGRLEMRRLTFTTAPNATQTATIIVNGATFTAQLDTNGNTLASTDLSLLSFTGWSLFSNDVTVLFQASSLGPRSGTYSFTSTGNAVASFSSVTSGTLATDTWVYQEDWNRDRMDGSKDTLNRSKKTLDPSKGNIYTIQYKYLGYGVMNYYIDDPSSQEPILVHTDENPNSLQTTNIAVPILKAGWIAFNEGSAGDVEVFGGSAFGGMEGELTKSATRNPRGQSSTANVGTSLVPVLSLRNRREFDGIINLTEFILDAVSAACEGTKVTSVSIILNGTLTDPSWQYVNQSKSIVEKDEVATAITGGTELFTFSLGKTDSKQKDLIDYAIKILPTQIITFACKTTSSTSDFSVGFTWTEV